MGLFGDKEAVFRYSRLRIACVAVFVCSLILTEIGRFVYRPYAYRLGLEDFGLADTMGNSFGAVTQIFFILAVVHSNWREGLRVIAFVVCGYIVYEFLQPVLPRGTFDVKDVVATIVGGIIAVGILWLAKRLAGDRVLGEPKREGNDVGAA
jgi:hypothetical protein